MKRAVAYAWINPFKSEKKSTTKLLAQPASGGIVIGDLAGGLILLRGHRGQSRLLSFPTNHRTGRSTPCHCSGQRGLRFGPTSRHTAPPCVQSSRGVAQAPRCCRVLWRFRGASGRARPDEPAAALPSALMRAPLPSVRRARVERTSSECAQNAGNLAAPCSGGRDAAESSQSARLSRPSSPASIDCMMR